MLVTLDFGSQVDLLNKRELQDALREDAALRSVLTGIKGAEAFYPLSVINPGAAVGLAVFTTPASMVGSGYTWAIMNVGFELSVAAQVRIWRQGFSGTTNGANRFVTQTGSTVTGNASFSKGQCTVRGGELLTFQALGAALILSVFISAIEAPAERFGEVLV